MIEVRLYGRLRRLAPDPRADQETVILLEAQPNLTVGAILERLGVSIGEIAHIFLNGALLTTCNSMAPWLRYQQVQEDIPTCEPDLDHPLRDGDRLGVFGRDMAMLVV